MISYCLFFEGFDPQCETCWPRNIWKNKLHTRATRNPGAIFNAKLTYRLHYSLLVGKINWTPPLLWSETISGSIQRSFQLSCQVAYNNQRATIHLSHSKFLLNLFECRYEVFHLKLFSYTTFFHKPRVPDQFFRDLVQVRRTVDKQRWRNFISIHKPVSNKNELFSFKEPSYLICIAGKNILKEAVTCMTNFHHIFYTTDFKFGRDCLI